MASLFVCGFECQTNAATAGQMHWPSRGGTGTTLTIDTTTVRTGAAALRILTAAQAGRFVHDLDGASPGLAVLRIYFRFASFPTAEQDFLRFTAASVPNGEVRCDSTGRLRARVGTTDGAYTSAISLGTWYRLDVRFDRSQAASAVLDWRLDGIEQTQVAQATGAASTLNTLFVGWGNASTADVYFDDVIIGTATGDYPFGSGYVKGYSPNVDGTHSFTAGDFKYTDTTNVGTGATDVNTYVDDLPTNNTDYVYQAVINAAGYLAVGFANSSESTAPRAIDAVVRYSTSAAANATATWKLNDGGTLNDVFSGIVNASGGAIVDKHYSTKPSGGAWTDSAFDALLMHFGYSDDVTPFPRWQSAILEAEFAEAAVGAGLRNQIILVG